ncbi:hypothetical protein IMZ48_20340 [Candidatus Bathyarchaeota archaeon]|nr:hypothetical protein [Candidatus Bathyarchaeota archaeon]
MRVLAACARRAAVRAPAGFVRQQWRSFSASSAVRTAAQSDSKRPLDGIRVLDMTRVLAGVSPPRLRHQRLRWAKAVNKLADTLTLAVLHADTGRPRVCGFAFCFTIHIFPGRRVLTLSDRAEVIKVEHPVRGDDTRAWGPPFAKYTPESGLEGPGESAYYLSVRIPRP